MRGRASTLDFTYRFERADGRREVVSLSVSLPQLSLIPPSLPPYPDWTRLGFQQCPNCPLDPASTEHCPVAIPMVVIGARLGGLVSHEPLKVDVDTPERHVRAEADSQMAVRSLLGLVMAVSGCPHMAFFKPLARFHLPLAGVEETLVRAASFYLLQQYFTREHAGEWDLEFTGLARLYEEVQTVNKGMAERLRAAGVFDELNWIAQLDALAQILPMAIEEHIRSLAYLFRPEGKS